MSVNYSLLQSLKDPNQIRQELGEVVSMALDRPLDRAEPHLRKLFDYYAYTKGKPENYLAALALYKVYKKLPAASLSADRLSVVREARQAYKVEIDVHRVCGNVFGLQNTCQSIGIYEGLTDEGLNNLKDLIIDALTGIDFGTLLSHDELQFIKTVFEDTNPEIGLLRTGFCSSLGESGHTAYVVYSKADINSLYIICNRGTAGKQSIDAHQVQKPVQQAVQLLQETRDKGSEKLFKKVAYTSVPQMLLGEKNRLTDCLERLSPKRQKTGNCVWASLKTAFRAIAILTRIYFKGRLAEDDLIDAVEASKKLSTEIRKQFLEHYLEDPRFTPGSVYRDDYMVSQMQGNIRKRRRKELCDRYKFLVLACVFAASVLSTLGFFISRMDPLAN